MTGLAVVPHGVATGSLPACNSLRDAAVVDFPFSFFSTEQWPYKKAIQGNSKYDVNEYCSVTKLDLYVSEDDGG